MAKKKAAPKSQRPPQRQKRQPGMQAKMEPQPQVAQPEYRGSGKLHDKVALITGGDSGIGRSVAVCFAKEGADVAVLYLNEHDDAREAERLVKACGRQCEVVAGDVGDDRFCRRAVASVVKTFGKLDIVINNAAEQHPKESLEEISRDQLERTFATNIFSMFAITREALQHLGAGAAIINTTSVTAYRGSPHLLDYSATKGAIVAFTRSLACVAGWSGNSRKRRGTGADMDAPYSRYVLGRAGRAVRLPGAYAASGRPRRSRPLATCSLASADSSYMTGQVLHPNGGEIING